MAIKLTNLQVISNAFENKAYVFNDLQLDVKFEENNIVFNYDVAAIKNSLRNLFNTLPGQRLLFPTYGCSLYKYLFEPINSSTAFLIGQEISDSIQKYETRVKLIKCDVVAVPDDYTYNIGLYLQMKTTTKNFLIQAALNNKDQEGLKIL